MKITVEQLEDLYSAGEMELDGKMLEIVEEGEWEQEHKSQSLELIFTDGERFYSGYIGRSGSYHSGWDYDSEIYGRTDLTDILEVEKKEVVVTQ